MGTLKRSVMEVEMDWISVDERLPPHSISVLVLDRVETVAMGMLYPKGTWTIYFPIYGEDVVEYPITHWAALPPPPSSDTPAPT